MSLTLNDDTCFLSYLQTIEKSAEYQESWWYKNGHLVCFPVCFVFVAISMILPSFKLFNIDIESFLSYALLATPFFTLVILLISIVLFACKKPKYGSAVFLFFWTPIVLAYLFCGIFSLLYFGGIYENDDTLEQMSRTSSLVIGICFTVCSVVYCVTTWTMLEFYKRHTEQYSFCSHHNPCMLGLMVILFGLLAVVLSMCCIFVMAVVLQGDGDSGDSVVDCICCDGGIGGGSSGGRKRRQENSDG